MRIRRFDPSRRQMLGFASAAAGLAALGRSGHAFQGGGGKKTLVCVFLAGGNDGHNLVVPSSSLEYAAYAAARQNLAVAQGSLLPITLANPTGVSYGLHPAVPELQQLFQGGKLAIVPNVGTMIEPVTKAEVLANAKPLPPQLFSHNDQQRQWELPSAGLLGGAGWGGLLADLLAPPWNPGSEALTSVTLSGANPLLIGQSTTAYALGIEGPEELYGFDDTLGMARKVVFDAILQASQQNALQREFGDVMVDAQALAGQVENALTQAPAINTPFDPESHLAQQLLMVARLIAVQDVLGIQRQLFLTTIGGFDTHDSQLALQPALLGDVSRSLASFQGALVELGLEDEVVLFTISDFGRTLSSNGDGTDHAWGAPHLVLGGTVRGGDFHGTYPDLSVNGPDDIGGGRIVPSASVEQYAATLARWFGASDPELLGLFPNLANFATSDLGFL